MPNHEILNNNTENNDIFKAEFIEALTDFYGYGSNCVLAYRKLRETNSLMKRTAYAEALHDVNVSYSSILAMLNEAEKNADSRQKAEMKNRRKEIEAVMNVIRINYEMVKSKFSRKGAGGTIADALAATEETKEEILHDGIELARKVIPKPIRYGLNKLAKAIIDFKKATE